MESRCDTSTNNTCLKTYFPDNLCGVNNLCIERCVDNVDTCQYQPVDCTQQIDLVQRHGAANASCYSLDCVPATGECVETFNPGPCTYIDLVALYGNNAQCFEAVCADLECKTVFKDNAPCNLAPGDLGSRDPQCYTPMCDPTVGACRAVPQVDKSCNDGNACTIYPNTTDPLSYQPSDRCIPDPDKIGEVVCVGLISPCYHELNVTEDALAGCNVTCVAELTGHSCLNPCVLAPRSHAANGAKVGAIVGATVGSVCGLALVIAAFAVFFKIAHSAGLIPGANANTGQDMMSDNPLFAPAGTGGQNVLFSPQS